MAHTENVDSLLENLAAYPIIEMVRTGRIAMLRGPQAISVPTTEPVEVASFHQASGRRPEGALPYVSE